MDKLVTISTVCNCHNYHHQVLLSAPSQTERQSILSVHCRALLPKHCPTPDLHHLAALTPGFVGADLQAVVASAATHLSDCQVCAYECYNVMGKQLYFPVIFFVNL